MSNKYTSRLVHTEENIEDHTFAPALVANLDDIHMLHHFLFV